MEETANPMGDSDNQKASQYLEAITAKLAEHFDSVRIVATRQTGNGQNTAVFTTGSGNYFAQLGSVKEWVVKQDELSRIEQREEGED